MPDPEMGLVDLLPTQASAAAVLDQLRGVIDPELGVNIVDLGLVYDAGIADGVADVLMTTTTPACPIGSYLSDEIRWALLALDSVLDVRVEITHDPRWSPERMSDAARDQLGWPR
jgi:metal-sulfur cluster biosynthetic enzyme